MWIIDYYAGKEILYRKRADIDKVIKIVRNFIQKRQFLKKCTQQAAIITFFISLLRVKYKPGNMCDVSRSQCRALYSKR